MYSQEEKEFYMSEAIKEAKKAESIREVPIGAVVVFQGEIIGRGHNLRESSRDATTHAELLAIQDACHKMGNWRLEGAHLFVTLEPCPMCSGGILLSRIEEVYYGASDLKAGAAGTLLNLLNDQRFNHQSYVEKGILEEECGALLTSFFSMLRKEKKQIKNEKMKKKAGLLDESLLQ